MLGKSRSPAANWGEYPIEKRAKVPVSSHGYERLDNLKPGRTNSVRIRRDGIEVERNRLGISEAFADS